MFRENGETNLPIELAIYIFQYLSVKNLADCNRVSHAFFDLANDNHIWQELFKKSFPGMYKDLLKENDVNFKERYRILHTLKKNYPHLYNELVHDKMKNWNQFYIMTDPQKTVIEELCKLTNHRIPVTKIYSSLYTITAFSAGRLDDTQHIANILKNIIFGRANENDLDGHMKIIKSSISLNNIYEKLVKARLLRGYYQLNKMECSRLGCY